MAGALIDGEDFSAYILPGEELQDIAPVFGAEVLTRARSKRLPVATAILSRQC